MWEALARTGLISALFFPPPSVVAAALWRLIVSGVLPAGAALSLRRMFLGFALAAVPAVVLGLAMGRSRRLRDVADPLVACLHPVPKIAVLPLIMVILGIGEASILLVVALGVFFPILINTAAGVRQISPIHFEVAHNYGAGPLKVLTRVLLPGSLPMVLAGVRLGLNIALLLTIALEMVSGSEGLGGIVWRSWETFRVRDIYATLAVISLLGVAFNAALQVLSRRLVLWQPEREI